MISTKEGSGNTVGLQWCENGGTWRKVGGARLLTQDEAVAVMEKQIREENELAKKKVAKAASGHAKKT